MPALNLLRLRAAQNNTSFSSEATASATTDSLTPARHPTRLVRCEYCLRIIPIKSTRQHHIAATPECRAAEQAKIRARRRSQEARRQTGALDGLPIEGAVRVSGQPEPVGHAPEPTVEHAPEPAAENTPEPVERRPKRHKVTMETVPDEDAPVTIEPPMTMASGSSMPFVGEASRTHADPVVDTSSMHVGPEPEPPRPSSGAQNRAGRHARGGLRRWKGLYVEDFPDPLAGAPISEDRAPEPDLDAYMRSCGTLADPWNFEAAELLTTSGMTDTAKDRHLKSRLYEGRTPWPNVDAMNKDIDKLPHGPAFDLYDIDIFDGQRPRTQFMVSCNIIQAVRDLFANQSFKEHFHAAPERHWLSPRKDQRVYSEIRTANWWWREQEKMQGKGPATIAPLIISSDVTTLSIMCGGQKAYPVYASVGNIDKSVRRQQSQGAMVLLGLLPVDAFEDVQNDDERRRLKADLVHRAVEKMLEPLKQASEEGIDMWCPDGRLRRVYPRIAAYMADWPEQNLHSCTSEGSCPVCSTQWGDRGNNERPAPLRDREETLNAIRAYFAYRDVGELRELNLRPVWPWWGDLPHVNLASCFTPDLLHQLYQGVFKSHLVRWMKHLVGADKLDERFAAMPDAEGMRHFTKGITSVQQWTGRESKEMVSQILPIVVGELTPEECRLVRSVIDFVFRAHASSMTDKDLEELERDLSLFHELKGLLVVKGFYQSEKRFNRIPKIHMLSHYAHSIHELGTPDGYNTETSERLHIEYAKVPWRASNKVRPLPQMLKYIQRQRAIRIHRAYLDRYLGIERDKDGEEDEETVEIGDGTEEHVGREAIGSAETGIDVAYPDGEGVEGEVSRNGADLGVGEIAYPNPWRHMAANPTKRNVLIKDVIGKYGAADLTSAITRFMTKRLGVPAHDVLLSPYNRLNIWHRLYLHHRPLPFAPLDPPRRDVIRASPAVLTGGGCVRDPPVWDTALYLERPNRLRSREDDDGEEKHGVVRYRAGRVRTLFTLPGHLRHYYSGQLAYLELFAPFDASVSPFSKMHSTQPDFDSHNRRRTLVVPITEIFMACHLAPKFHRLDSELKLTASTDLLAISKHFWLNHYYNHYSFQLIQHWWRRRPTLRERLLRHVH